MSFPSPRRSVTALLLLLAALLSGCAGLRSKETTVWTSRGQFVSIVEREGEPAAANQQPAIVSGAKLRAELASLQIKLPEEKNFIPLFGAGELENLSEQLPIALRQAGPNQDVIFAIIGEKPYFIGLVNKNFVTTGRVFYRDNRLNLVLGLTRELVQGQDRRLQPFTPGSRREAAQLPGALTTTSPAVSFASGRPDWITMALPEGKGEEQAIPAVPQPAAQPVSPPAARPVPQPVSEPSQPATAPEAKKTAPVPAPETTGAARPGNIEERLRVLRDLKEKGLITDEEYRAKKESILKEL